ncbi:MAG: non-hydrolyzing UDP-N-acetylglucosamine 2-epimerase [Flavobacteriales bacterium]
MKILTVVGTRPNFIKITQFRKVFDPMPDVELKIVHTGQHYDHKMSTVFFDQFGFQPDIFLDISQRAPGPQTGEIMMKLSELFMEEKPDLVITPGDVNSTLACSLAANKCGIKVAHLESGLRSSDRTMPEEINRILTDEITDMYFVTEQSGLDHLAAEGKDEQKVHFVGNTMIDTLVAFEDEISASDVLDKYELEKGEFYLMTMHRPATVDIREGLEFMANLIKYLTKNKKVVFPIHPRTMKNLQEEGLFTDLAMISNLVFTEPMDYFSFQRLVRDAHCILTDSGGIQEESTFRQVPCFTLRPNTERPSTITMGTNVLLPNDLETVIAALEKPFKQGEVPPLWDGKATERIGEIIQKLQ